jgi:hypothetical protein
MVKKFTLDIISSESKMTNSSEKVIFSTTSVLRQVHMTLDKPLQLTVRAQK